MTEVISWKELFPTQPLIDFSMNLFAAILVIIFTLFVSRLIKSWIARLGFKYSQLDDTLFVFLSKFAQIVILVVGATFVLNSLRFY